MEIVDDGTCFACGKLNEHGLHLSFSIDENEKTAKTDFAVPQRFNGWENSVHGGIISTIMDESMVYACAGVGLFVVTGELTVRFKKPVPVEKTINIIAKVTSQNSRIMETEATILMNGKPLASAKGRMFIMRKLTDSELRLYRKGK